MPPDTAISRLETDVDESLADTDVAGVKVIQKEKEELDKLDTARNWQIAAKTSESLAAIAQVIPTLSADGKPFGVGAGVNWGGTQLGNAISAAAKIFDFIGSFDVHSASTAAKMASYIRREQEWTLQANLAAKDIVARDKQIVSAQIQVQIAEKELANHKQSIENSSGRARRDGSRPAHPQDARRPWQMGGKGNRGDRENGGSYGRLGCAKGGTRTRRRAMRQLPAGTRFSSHGPEKIREPLVTRFPSLPPDSWPLPPCLGT